MSRAALFLLALAIALAGVIALDMRPNMLEGDAMLARPTRPTAVVAARPPAATPDDRSGEWVATILARPLFAPDRRPVATEGAAPSDLPRLTAILLDGPRRQVIFAGADGGRPRVVAEGGDLDGYRVQSIEAGQVTIIGPKGPHVVRPSFDPRPPATPAAGAKPPSLSGLTGIPGLPIAR